MRRSAAATPAAPSSWNYPEPPRRNNSHNNSNLPSSNLLPGSAPRPLPRIVGGSSASSTGGSTDSLTALWAKQRLWLWGSALFCITAFTLFPILILESLSSTTTPHRHPLASGQAGGVGNSRQKNHEAHVSVGQVLRAGGASAPASPPEEAHPLQRLEQQQQEQHPDSAGLNHALDGVINLVPPQDTRQQELEAAGLAAPDGQAQGQDNQASRTTKDGRVLPLLTLSDLAPLSDDDFVHKPVARGVAGRPLEQTPALVGAQRAHIPCEAVNVDSLAYWNDPQGTRDVSFQSPFSVPDDQPARYISFAPDHGGWNNVRMSMEIIFVLAAATGRTLVLPPKEPLYLLQHDSAQKHRGFADFFPLDTLPFQNKVKVIPFADFLLQEKLLDGEGDDKRRIKTVPEDMKLGVEAAAEACDKRAQAPNSCQYVYDYLAMAGHIAEMSAVDTCLVFDENAAAGHPVSDAEVLAYVESICGPQRRVLYWDQSLQDQTLLHFKASEKQFRLLTHFYGMIHFTNPALDHYFRRFVRDFLHYHDSIYCAAGIIVKAVQWEGLARGFQVDEEGAGAFSALHVRRGDLQYKKVKIPASEWYNNTREVWQPKEILYVATDERDKSFFHDLAVHHDLRFLDDYWELAGLGKLDPNYMGMIDTIVASRGRAFAGTWFSTFSGYINRLRGYHGMSMMDSWYSFLPKKTAVQEWKLVNEFVYAYEFPDGWIGIDADTRPSRDKF